MKKYDVVIIGSGLGGLSAGATLAKNGKKVLVLEQHSLIGGCATCFKRKGMLVDAGLHEMDWGDPKTDMKHLIFKDLGLDKRVELIKLPSAWSVVEMEKDKGLKQTTQIPHGNTEKALIELFPDEAMGIKKYFKKIRFQAFLVRRFPFDMKFLDFFFAPLSTLIFLANNAIRNKSVGEVLNACINSSKLKRLLNINISYYHHNPFSFIWSFHAIPQKHYYEQGVYIKGGSQSLSDALSAIITENGGEVRANCEVKEILIDGNTANGVIFSHKNELISVYGDKIIANSDPYYVYTKLLKDKPIDTTKDLQMTQKFKLSTSLISLYMIFDRNISEIYPEMDYANFLVDSAYFNQKFDAYHADAINTPLENRDFAFVNYSKIDSGLSQREDRFLGVGAVYSNYEEWELSKEEYKAKKEWLKNLLEQRLEQAYPGIMQYCIHSELATPKTIERYIWTRKGVIYGYDQDREGYFGRERFKSKSVKNLYFASAFGFPGGGFTGAILSGYRTAKKILDPYLYVRRISLCVVFGTLVSMGISKIISLFA